METISIFEAKNNLSALIANITQRGDSHLICKDGRPVAELVMHKSKDRLKASNKLRVTVKGDLFEDDQTEEWECLR